METQAQILSVYTRNTSKGSVYDVNLSDGTSKSTWDPQVAAALNQYAGSGQVVSLRYDQKPSRDGRFMNETITAFAPPGQAMAPEVQVNGPMQMPMGGGMQPGVMQQPQQMQPMQTAPQIPQAPPRRSGFDDPNVVMRITKLACISDAAQFVGLLLQGAGPEAVTEALALVRSTSELMYGWARSHESAPTAPVEQQVGVQGQVVSQQPVSGSQIAADVPGVALGAPQVVDVSTQDPSEWD